MDLFREENDGAYNPSFSGGETPDGVSAMSSSGGSNTPTMWWLGILIVLIIMRVSWELMG